MARTTSKAAVVEAPEVETPAQSPAEAVLDAIAETTTEAPAPEAPEEPQVFVLDSTALDAEVNARYQELLPFLVLGKRKDRKLNVEVRTAPELRMRMVCTWGRKSYFAPISEVGEDGTPVIPAPVKAAILRQIDREFGRAIRVIKADEKAAKRLEKLIADRKAAGKETPDGDTADEG